MKWFMLVWIMGGEGHIKEIGPFDMKTSCKMARLVIQESSFSDGFNNRKIVKTICIEHIKQNWKLEDER